MTSQWKGCLAALPQNCSSQFPFENMTSALALFTLEDFTDSSLCVFRQVRCFDCVYAQIFKLSWATTKMPIMSNCSSQGGLSRDHKCTRLRPSEWVAEVADNPEVTVQTEKQDFKKVRCGGEIAKRVTHASMSQKWLQIKMWKKEKNCIENWVKGSLASLLPRGKSYLFFFLILSFPVNPLITANKWGKSVKHLSDYPNPPPFFWGGGVWGDLGVYPCSDWDSVEFMLVILQL